jgi:DNA-binding IclR family transcriptional regulator
VQGRADANRSLERGIEILRAFKPGVAVLGNGELAERTGLPRSTVSRLVGTLLQTGLIEEVRSERGFRLAPAMIALGHAAQLASPLLAILGQMMRVESARLKVNVGLAAADRLMMVYVETIRYNTKASLRVVEAGLQIPIELTSLGRAYLAALPEPLREQLVAELLARRSANSRELVCEIEEAISSVREKGYCAASWQPGVLAVAAPIVVPGLPVHSMNFSTQLDGSEYGREGALGANLLAFIDRCIQVLADQGMEANRLHVGRE